LPAEFPARIAPAMFKHQILAAVRHIARRRALSALNIVGLAVGLACCLLIGQYVYDEWSFDRFHDGADRIFRVVNDTPEGGWAVTGPGFALHLPSDYAEIEAVARVHRSQAIVSPEVGTRFTEQRVLHVDPAFLDVFSFTLISGDAATALADPSGVLLTQSASRRYFGDGEAIGQTLVLEGRADRPYRVTGVLANPPLNSHLQFDLVSNWATLTAGLGVPEMINSFWWPQVWTYVRLGEGADAVALDADLAAFARRHREPEVAARFIPRLEPLTEIRLHAAYEARAGSIASVRLFGVIAIVVLLLACVNFMNLSTARGAERAREVGVRKTLGARRSQVAAQFLGEAMLLSGVAAALALSLAAVALPWFNDLAGKDLSLVAVLGPGLWASIAVLVLGTGIAAGSYPAFVLSRYQPVRVLKGAANPAGGAGLRRALVVFQFTVSVALLAGTAVAFQQLAFMRDANLGFDKEHTLVLPADGLTAGVDGRYTGFGGAEATPDRYASLRDELERLPSVRRVTASTTSPGFGSGMGRYLFEAEGRQPGGESDRMRLDLVGHGYFEQFGLQMLAGRSFLPDFVGDRGRIELAEFGQMRIPHYRDRGVVLNEAAARHMGWTPEGAIGQSVRFYIVESDIVYQDFRGQVVGIVEDHHAGSLHERIEPHAYQLAEAPDGSPMYLQYVLVKLGPGDARETLAAAEAAWQRVLPDQPFESAFLDAEIDALYQAEIRQSQVIAAFTALAGLIACFGLFGLSAYATERRRKELGVRKVLGARTGQLVALVAREFVVLVAVAAVLATPIAWIVMGRWLEGFAYQITLGPWLFVLAGLTALLVALLTVSGQALRAALADPVAAIRRE
jgi:putative ABC transport system permease protein